MYSFSTYFGLIKYAKFSLSGGWEAVHSESEVFTDKILQSVIFQGDICIHAFKAF